MLTNKQEIIKRLLESKQISFEEMMCLFDLNNFSYSLTSYSAVNDQYKYNYPTYKTSESNGDSKIAEIS